MSVTETTIPRQNPKTVWRKYLKGVVVEPGIALNETAAAIFTRIDGARTLADIAREVAQEFEVDYPTCLEDTSALLEEFVEQGFVLVDERAQA